MARVDLTAEQVNRQGLVPTFSTPTAEGDVVDTGRVVLVVENIGTSSVTVTVESPVTVYGLEVEENTVTVAAGDTSYIGPWERSVFGRPAGTTDAGRMYVNYSAAADVSRAAIAL